MPKHMVPRQIHEDTRGGVSLGDTRGVFRQGGGEWKVVTPRYPDWLRAEWYFFAQDGSIAALSRETSAGTNGLSLSRANKDAWEHTRFWPNEKRTGEGPAMIHVTDTKLGALYSYAGKYDGSKGLWVEPPGLAPRQAVPPPAPGPPPLPGDDASAAYRTWQVLETPRSPFPFVTARVATNIHVAVPIARGGDAIDDGYRTLVIPGGRGSDLWRLPPRRADGIQRLGGEATCSEAVAEAGTDILHEPVLVLQGERIFLLYLKYGASKRYRWTLIPEGHSARCDWLAMPARTGTSLVVAEVSADAGIAKAVLEVPLVMRVSEPLRDFGLQAFARGGVVEVIASHPGVAYYLELNLRNASAAPLP
jgi:hypothetical protein